MDVCACHGMCTKGKGQLCEVSSLFSACMVSMHVWKFSLSKRALQITQGNPWICTVAAP